MKGKDLKQTARLNMTALVNNGRRSFSTGVIIEITQRGIRVQYEDRANDFVKWQNVLEIK